MAWGGFWIALLITYVLQVTVVWRFGGAWIDLYLIFALVCGLVARAPEGRLAGWLIGLAQDLTSASPLGLHAFTLGLAAMLVVWLREFVNTRWWGPRVAVAALAATPSRLLELLHAVFWVSGGDASLLGIAAESIAVGILSAAAAILITAMPTWLINIRPRSMGAGRRR